MLHVLMNISQSLSLFITSRVTVPSVVTIPRLGSRLWTIKASLATQLPTNSRFQSSIVTIKMERVDTTARLAKLRELMSKHEVDIYGKVF